MKSMYLSAALLSVLFLFTTPALRAATSVNAGSILQISGPADPNLDLAGEIVHAINFSANDPALFVNGVTFTPDRDLAPGLTVGPNNVAPWGTTPVFGSGLDADNLETVYQDIRWAQPSIGQALEAHLPVTAGETYKVQLLFYGNGAENRRWDIEVEGSVDVDEVSSRGIATGPAVADLPPYSGTAGIVFSRTITVADSTLDIRMGNLGGVNDGGDRNPIWQGLTVEHVVPDTDTDGLPDAYEITAFGSTAAQAGTGDADSDTLSNQHEYQIGSNPNAPDTDGDGLSDSAEYFTRRTKVLIADTDGDGLSDGSEVNVHLTNPLVADTDGDGLSDGAEVNTHGSNPLDRDSDDDDYADGFEVARGTSPTSAAAYPLYSTQIHAFTGGDQGEGLDFAGTFIAAARFGLTTLSGSWPVRDAVFIPYHQVAGLTQNAANQIGGWVAPAFASPTANDTNLAQVITSIRYSTPTIDIAIPGLTAGRSYKVQLLFAEQCCANRGFDVLSEGVLIGDEFSPPAVQGGASGTPTRGAAIIHGFVASDSTLNIRLTKVGVTTPALSDVNAIINAISVEEIPAGADLDGDFLPDSWEIDNFGSTGAQTGTGDADNDGLTNFQELTNVTDPNDPDTDNDGINDGPEVNTHGTNPRSSDTDSDGLNDSSEVNIHLSNPNDPDTDDDTLSDGAEVNTHGSSPLSRDGDNDGFNDPTEVLNASNPSSNSSTPPASHVARVLGGDAGEGLDLTGTFPYAFNVGTNPVPVGLIQDADFTLDSAPGITISAPNQILNWTNPQLGATPQDDALETVLQSIRWADLANADPTKRAVRVDLANLVIGRQYKLQLLFSEQCCPNRTFDVSVDGALVYDNFSISTAQGPTPAGPSGAAIVYSFTAADDTLNILLDGAGVPPFPGLDPNATLSGLTLESLVVPVALDITSVAKGPLGLKLNTRGTPGISYSVDWSSDLVTWEEVHDALVHDPAGDATWTDTALSRVGPAIFRGFYKLRDPVLDPTP